MGMRAVSLRERSDLGPHRRGGLLSWAPVHRLGAAASSGSQAGAGAASSGRRRWLASRLRRADDRRTRAAGGIPTGPGARPHADPGGRLRLRARRRTTSRDRIPGRAGSRTACTGCRAPTTRRASPGPTHAWTGRQLAGGVIYELHVGTFTPEGTLDAAIGRLDHLAELGVDFVELMPVNAFNGPHNWGYDGVLWFAVHAEYGGPAAYQRFVDACHARGLAVIQDVVYNHLGPSGNYLPEFAPYLHTGATNTWGDIAQPRRRALRRGPALHRRQRLDVAERLPRRRSAAGRRARAGRHPGDAHPGGAGHRDRRAQRLPGPAAVADRRVRPQRSAADHRPGRPAATG